MWNKKATIWVFLKCMYVSLTLWVDHEENGLFHGLSVLFIIGLLPFTRVFGCEIILTTHHMQITPPPTAEITSDRQLLSYADVVISTFNSHYTQTTPFERR